MSLFKSFYELCNVVSVVAHCPSDETILLALENATNVLWIPTWKLMPGQSLIKQTLSNIQDIFGVEAINSHKLNKQLLIWIPNHKNINLHHYIFELEVNVEQKKRSRNAIGYFSGKVRWMSDVELKKSQLNHSLKSPELLSFFKFAKTALTSNMYDLADGYLCLEKLIELDQNVLISGRSNIYETVVDLAGFDQGVQETLYREFLFSCYPANYMGYQMFGTFLTEIGWVSDDTVSLFRAADIHNRYGLSFREFVYFMAVVEPTTNHGGAIAELRCRYIFRYFDENHNNCLKYADFTEFTKAVRLIKKQSPDPSSLSKDVSEQFRLMGFPETHSITLSEFLRAAGELKVRGTSQLLRAPISILKYTKKLMEKDAKFKIVPNFAGRQNSVPNDTINTNSRSNDKNYASYELAVHTIKIQKSGTAIDVDQLFSMENAVTVSSTRQPTINEDRRKHSVELFSQSSDTNELLKALRYLTLVNKMMLAYLKGQELRYNWGKLNADTVGKYLINVCGQVKRIFMKEPRLLELSSPIYIMGDLHGNFADVLYFEKIFWHTGPALCPCNLLFLGDYVDRGAFSIEVISYLFCYKVQSPHKVNLLRGNHEIRQIQIQWTFQKECRIKFGDKLGNEVFAAVNAAFDVMPVAAVIDAQVFCCHGGVPPPWLCPLATAINEIPLVLSEPQKQSPLAWELVWNDPVRNKNMTEKTAMELLTNEGFAANSRRGTGHVFSVEALEHFLKTNSFTHFIRAHEVVEAGIHVQQKGKLLTVFSSSKYCGGQNEAACVLATHGTLRVLRLETQ